MIRLTFRLISAFYGRPNSADRFLENDVHGFREFAEKRFAHASHRFQRISPRSSSFDLLRNLYLHTVFVDHEELIGKHPQFLKIIAPR